MSQSLINDVALEKILFEKLNESMLKAAEPILKKALEEIEQTMRKDMAARLIAFIESNFSIERYQDELRIVVKQAMPK